MSLRSWLKKLAGSPNGKAAAFGTADECSTHSPAANLAGVQHYAYSLKHKVTGRVLPLGPSGEATTLQKQLWDKDPNWEFTCEKVPGGSNDG